MPTAATNRFPSQIKYIIGNEACERFSYYGMRAILVLFMTTQLSMPKDRAVGTYHYFISACYLLPLLGAWISDRFWGKYKTILYLSVVYCLGHGALALFESESGMYWGLGLLALGAGGIKPCVSAHVGDQFTERNKSLLDKVFSIFYFSVNFGAFFSQMLIPWIRTQYGARLAFGIPGILMALATVIFWMGRKQYVHVPPTGKTGKAGFVPVLFHALTNLRKKKKGHSFLEAARGKHSADEIEAAKSAWDIFKVFITVSGFWALFDQQGSSWVLQAQRMDLNFLGTVWQPDQIQALNPILVMLLTPLFSFWLYPAVNRRIPVTPLRKMSVGMCLTALSFVSVGLIETILDAGVRLSVGWQFIPFLILTASEVMVSITGLEFAYTQAPRSMKSTIMSFWLLTVFVGNMFAGLIAQLNVFKGPMFFYFFAAMMTAVSILFIIAAVRYKVREYLETSTQPMHPVAG